MVPLTWTSPSPPSPEPQPPSRSRRLRIIAVNPFFDTNQEQANTSEQVAFSNETAPEEKIEEKNIEEANPFFATQEVKAESPAPVVEEKKEPSTTEVPQSTSPFFAEEQKSTADNPFLRDN